MAAKAAENPAAGSRTVTVRIDDPPDVCSRAKVKNASALNAARFCEALALQNPTLATWQRTVQGDGQQGRRDHCLGLTDRRALPRSGGAAAFTYSPLSRHTATTAVSISFRKPRPQ